jgi:hypothetical protein
MGDVKVVPLKMNLEVWTKLNYQKDGKSWEEFLLNIDDWELIHTNIHALRMTSGYKPSAFEIKVSNIIIQRFKHSCKECLERDKQLNSSEVQEQVKEKGKEKGKKGVKDIFMDVLKGDE